MGTTFRNEEGLTQKEVLEKFSTTLKENKNFSENEIEQLAETYSKNIVDKFIISDDSLDETFGRQGDILFWKEGSEMYNKEFPNVRRLKKTERLVLQKGDSLTGDHRLIPLPNSKFILEEGVFTPSFLKGKNSWGDRDYDCLILTIDKPFLVFHREHGNIAMTAGKYMICSQMDSSTLNRMLD